MKTTESVQQQAGPDALEAQIAALVKKAVMEAMGGSQPQSNGEHPAAPPAAAPALPSFTGRKITLKNPLSPGDILVMSAAIRSAHKLYPGQYQFAVDSPANAIYEHNPDVANAGEGFEEHRMHYPGIDQSDQRPIHFMEAYCEFLGGIIGKPLPCQVKKPVLVLSEGEKAWLPQVHEVTKKAVPYWVVNAGVKKDFTAKGWGADNYQALVHILRGRVQFVQVGEDNPSHVHKPLEGVINLIGKTDTRQLIRMCWHAQGGVGPSTFIQHVFAAFEKPYVCLLGGREPKSWTDYPTQETLSMQGKLPCCSPGACWRSRVVRLGDGAKEDGSLCEMPMYLGENVVPKCLAMLTPETVAEKILEFQLNRNSQ